MAVAIHIITRITKTITIDISLFGVRHKRTIIIKIAQPIRIRINRLASVSNAIAVSIRLTQVETVRTHIMPVQPSIAIRIGIERFKNQLLP